MSDRSRGLGVAALLALLCLALAWTHAGPASGGMDEEHMDGAMSAMCLAIAELATVAAIGVAALVALRARWRAPESVIGLRLTSAFPHPMPGAARQRAGPAMLQVFLR